ncbi:hypothetical protein [Planctomycetes bacterium Pla133]|uniref:Uncharacterized protein n=2 Tax=Engelhardtia mirabilis TaxID=2528011 RepID=A0A518BQU4_9BACT|nr:hypothetical protein Pla133_44670 [Planctomycetes bacterium Pla133]QDV03674.1 hypothetical protein Pla86_44650 [Planctomycetes bacterium Pla86]
MDEELVAELLDTAPDDPRRAALARARPDLYTELEALEATAAELDRRATERCDDAATMEGSESTVHERRLQEFALRAMATAPRTAADVAPSGPVAAWGTFRWPAAPAADGWVRRVRVWAAEQAAGPAALESSELRGTTWAPDASALEALPDAIRWRLVEIDPVSGQERVVHEAAAHLAR